MNMTVNKTIVTDLHLSTLRIALKYLSREREQIAVDLKQKGYCHHTDREIKHLDLAVNEINHFLNTRG